MPITPKNLVRHELIGLKVKIKNSTDPTLKGKSGRVVDETYNMLKIETRKKEISVPKKNCIFVFKLPSKIKVEVDGKLLVGRPEDRIKKKLPRW
jgi:ribonuclease P protein subunit POP4